MKQIIVLTFLLLNVVQGDDLLFLKKELSTSAECFVVSIDREGKATVGEYFRGDLEKNRRRSFDEVVIQTKFKASYLYVRNPDLGAIEVYKIQNNRLVLGGKEVFSIDEVKKLFAKAKGKGHGTSP